MCDPTIITAISVIGTGLRAFGQLQAGRAASQEAEFKSRIASNNAIIAGQNAQAELDKGRAERRDKQRETSQRIGLQRAQLAAQGFDVSQGSSIDILGDTAALGEFDALRIDADANNRARNFQFQQDNFNAEANLGSFASKNAKKAGLISAGGTLLGGGARAGATFLTLKGP
jgi:hypothetical protein